MAQVSMHAFWIAALVAGVGCSSGSSGSGGPGAEGGAHPTCSQLVAADVQGLMTNPVVANDVSPVGTDADGQQCILHDADSEQDVDVIVVPADDAVIGWDAARKSATNPVPLTGVGDEAFRQTGDVDPFAKHDNVLCTVSIGAAIQIPGVTALVHNGTLDLTDAQDAVISEALGTVCNRLFGIGNTTPDLSGLAP